MRTDCKVYVGNLGNTEAKHELESAFSKYGPLVNVWVARNPPGFAFVEFEDPRDAEDAVRALDGTTTPNPPPPFPKRTTGGAAWRCFPSGDYGTISYASPSPSGLYSTAGILSSPAHRQKNKRSFFSAFRATFRTLNAQGILNIHGRPICNKEDIQRSRKATRIGKIRRGEMCKEEWKKTMKKRQDENQDEEVGSRRITIKDKYDTS
nr:serine/arginine-rich splicing factor 2-like [Penaeus vannamei]